MRLILFLLLSSAAHAQLRIDFGKNKQIQYNLAAGVYDIVIDGKPVIKDAYAYSEDATSKDSRFIKSSIKNIPGGKLYVVERANMQQLFYIYKNRPYFFTQVKVNGMSNNISPLTTPNILQGENAYGLVVPFDNDMWVRYEVQAAHAASYTSSEVTALFNRYNRQGMVIGSIEHKTWKTGVRVFTSNNGISLSAFGGFTDAQTTHDKIAHGKVEGISPKIMVGFYSDWRTGMEEYAAVNKATEPPAIKPWKKATPVGWNSWGVLQTRLNLQNAKSVIDFFADTCKGFRNADNTLYIDLDSYWDNLKEDELKEFVSYCKSKKFVPGIYWAPFADWGKLDSAAWIKQNGQPVDLDGAYALDPTHPFTKDRIARYTSKFKQWGFEMIKIDFLGHAALESDSYYNKAVTTGMQAYNKGMDLLDSMLSGMLVYAAISPTMATGRYVHMRRIACDAFSAIDNTEYTMNSTGYGWWQSHLYQYADADHVVFKTEQEGANRARLVSALVTGTLITGDDFSSAGPWKQRAMQLLQNKALLDIIKDGKPFQPLMIAHGKQAPDTFQKRTGGKHWLAIFNYSDKPAYRTFDDNDLGFKLGYSKMKDLFTGAEVYGGTNPIEIPAASAVLYEVIYPK